jgi:hypothetical protein
VADQHRETKKAAGAFYTPARVVNDIVKQTLGRVLAGKTPFEVAARTRSWQPNARRRPLAVLDPTCGGGYFLTRAYQYLLDWYLRKYVADDFLRHTDRVSKSRDGPRRLTGAERMRILRDHIYGVDIDPLAVEVTRRSLLLKAFQGREIERVRATRDLGKNIKRGNALIGRGFEQHGRREDFHLWERSPFDVFHWSSEFPHVAAAGGFDGVIGNPPYIDSEWMTTYLKSTRDYCAGRYEAAAGNWDMFCVCSERALQLCRPGGLVSFIVPNKIGSANYARHIRRLLASDNRLLSLRDYSHVPVFPAGVYPIVFVVSKGKPALTSDTVRYETMKSRGPGEIAIGETLELDYRQFCSPAGCPWPVLTTAEAAQIVDSMSRFETLASVADVGGAATVAEAYDIRPLIRDCRGKSSGALKLVNSGTIDRYACLWGVKKCRYIGQSYVRPVIGVELEPRLPTRRRQQARRAKIIVAGMTRRLECIADLDGNVLAGKSTTIVTSDVDLRFLLGLLNSRLVSFYFSAVYGGNKLQGNYLRIGPPQVRTIPVPAASRRVHDRFRAGVSELVDAMLELKTKQQAADNPKQQTALDQRILAVDRQIDRLVYRLFDLTEEEIRTVEDGML